jgi:hypothetical protein
LQGQHALERDTKAGAFRWYQTLAVDHRRRLPGQIAPCPVAQDGMQG